MHRAQVLDYRPNFNINSAYFYFGPISVGQKCADFSILTATIRRH